jgi:hypothetical protein
MEDHVVDPKSRLVTTHAVPLEVAVVMVLVVVGAKTSTVDTPPVP